MNDALSEAFDRVNDFIAVQSAQGGIDLESVECLQLAVGIDSDARLLFKQRLEQTSHNSQPGGVLLGMILGLLAAQHEGGAD